LNYANRETELKMLKSKDPREKLKEIKAVLEPNDFDEIKKRVAEVKVPDAVAEYISRLLEKSRTWSRGSMPLSTRAGLALIRASKAWAWLNHRNYIRPDDVQEVMGAVFCHRLGGIHGVRKGREFAVSLQHETEVPI
jgi:MoxR-like ATPase